MKLINIQKGSKDSLASQIFRLTQALPASAQIPKYRGLQERCIFTITPVLILPYYHYQNSCFYPCGPIVSSSISLAHPTSISPSPSALSFSSSNSSTHLSWLCETFCLSVAFLLAAFASSGVRVRYSCSSDRC